MGFGFDEGKSWWSFLFAIIMLVAGGLPLLKKYNIINWGFVDVITSTVGGILSYVLAAGALFLIIDSFMEELDEPNGIITLIIGLAILAIGLLPIIGIAIPFIGSILTTTVYFFIFTAEGILLLLGMFMME